MFAPFRAAMNAAVPKKIGVNPCDGVELPRARQVRPLAWTAPRETAFREALRKRLREAEAIKGKRLTTVEREKIWASPDLRPCPVMVWLPAHCGQFLDSIVGERLFAAFIFTMFSGLRQDEVVGLNWPKSTWTRASRTSARQAAAATLRAMRAPERSRSQRWS